MTSALEPARGKLTRALEKLSNLAPELQGAPYMPARWRPEMQRLLERIEGLIQSPSPLPPNISAKAKLIHETADTILDRVGRLTPEHDDESAVRIVNELKALGEQLELPSTGVANVIRELIAALDGIKDEQVRKSLFGATAETLGAKVDALDAALSAAQASIQTALGHERMAGSARETAQTAATESTTLKEAAATAKNEIAKLLESAKTDGEAIKGLVVSVNQTGLAASFKARGEAVGGSLALWRLLFVVGIILLAGISVLQLIGPYRIQLPTDWSMIGPLLTRLLLAGPLIWFTWFSAKQYGHTLRVREDYAFKEAAAMAYSGYRKEMETDEKMLHFLRETAIRTFGENPVRILLNQPDHTTPLTEALHKFGFGRIVGKWKAED